jgi:hypothetical protein
MVYLLSYVRGGVVGPASNLDVVVVVALLLCLLRLSVVVTGFAVAGDVEHAVRAQNSYLVYSRSVLLLSPPSP